jgi:hypothetical protein
LPYLTPYNYASNEPATKIDLYGLQGFTFQHIFNRVSPGGYWTLDNRIKNGFATLTFKNLDFTTKRRMDVEVGGFKNATFGVVGTIGAVLAAPKTGGYSVVALPFTIGEAGVGFAQIADALSNTLPDPESPLHQSGTPFGLLAHKNGSKYAGAIDAATQLLPGMLSGGNLYGVFSDSRSLFNEGKNTTYK